MGFSPFAKSCFTNKRCYPDSTPVAISPNPDPSRWELIDWHVARRGYALKLKYLDCTNFEGMKIMVFRKHASSTSDINHYLYSEMDPHFSEDKSSPIARFQPTNAGWNMAIDLADRL